MTTNLPHESNTIGLPSHVDRAGIHSATTTDVSPSPPPLPSTTTMVTKTKTKTKVIRSRWLYLVYLIAPIVMLIVTSNQKMLNEFMDQCGGGDGRGSSGSDTLSSRTLLTGLVLPVPSSSSSPSLSLLSATSSTSSSISKSTTSPPDWRNMSWIGKTYVPPPGAKLYTPSELRDIFNQHSILVIGDSLGRRFYTTLLQILNTTAPADPAGPQHIPTEIAYGDYDKDPTWSDERRVERCPKWNVPGIHRLANQRFGSHCRKGNGGMGPNSVDYLGLQCYWMAEKFAMESSSPTGLYWNATQEYSLIIFAMGIWEVLYLKPCIETRDRDNRNRTIGENHLRSAIQAFDGMARSRNVVYDNNTNDATGNTSSHQEQHPGKPLLIQWRTGGFSSDPYFGLPRDEITQVALEHNHLAKDIIDGLANEQVSYVDWGSAIYPRSFGLDRINGNTQVHYGAEARLLLAQMLANALDKK